MMTYLQLAEDLIVHFEYFEITHVSRVTNSEANKLAKIRSGIDHDQGCPIEILLSSSVCKSSVNNANEE